MPKQREAPVQKNKLSKFIKKAPKNNMTKRDNIYVFEGFYQRLKNIDVKQAHTTGGLIDSNFGTVGMMQTGQDEEDIFNSNFISYLRTEKGNNKKQDFSSVYKDLEQHCFSYPLLVHNRSTVVDKLLGYLSPSSKVQSKIVQMAVVELLIALIKDFRQDIYEDFTLRIMPTVIATCLDIRNVDLLDKTFTLISFGVKYLSKSIKGDFRRFFDVY